MKKKLISILIALTVIMSLIPTSAFAAKMIGAKTTAALNLRKGAGTSYSKITVMPKGKQVIVISSSNGWSKLIVDNKIGYASSKYLTAQTKVSGDFGVGTLTGNDVRMRKGAGTGYSILGTYKKGTAMTVTGANGNWYAVSYNGKTGYVSADYMTLSVRKTLGSTTSVTTYTGTVLGTDVRIRSGAGTSYSTLGYCSKEKTVTVTGSKDGWYKIKYNGKTGYVYGQYVKIAPKTEYKTAKSASVSTATNLRMGPSTEFSVIVKSPKATELKILGEYGKWYYAEQGGKQGYIPASYVSINTSTPKTETGIVTGDSVRVRSGAGTSYKILGYLDSGDRVELASKTNGWYEIKYEGKKAYISAEYIKEGKSEKSSEQGEKIVKMAKTYLDTPYVYGGESPDGFDCSGFMYYLYGQFGYTLKRGAGGQYNNNGNAVKKSELQAGDLVFFSDDVDEVGHVGMYIGNGEFIHASSGRGYVCITELDSYYYKEHYTGAKRIFLS